MGRPAEIEAHDAARKRERGRKPYHCYVSDAVLLQSLYNLADERRLAEYQVRDRLSLHAVLCGSASGGRRHDLFVQETLAKRPVSLKLFERFGACCREARGLHIARAAARWLIYRDGCSGFPNAALSAAIDENEDVKAGRDAPPRAWKKRSVEKPAEKDKRIARWTKAGKGFPAGYREPRECRCQSWLIRQSMT